MSEMAKKAREASKAKAERMMQPTTGRIDASDFTYAEPLNTEAKTGMRPVSRRAYRTGGKVDGEAAKKNAGKKSRAKKAGGGPMVAPGTMQGVNGGLPPGLSSGLAPPPTGGAPAMQPGLAPAPASYGGSDSMGGQFRRGGRARATGGTVASYAKDNAKEANPSPHVGGYATGGVPAARMDFSGKRSTPLPGSGATGFKSGGHAKKRASGGALRRYVGSEEVTADELPEKFGVARPKTGLARDESTGKLKKNNPVVIPARSADEPAPRKTESEKDIESRYKAFRAKTPAVKPKLSVVDKALNRMGRKTGGSCDGEMQGTRPTGGRCARKEGGRTKGKTNINIIVNAGPKAPAPPMGGPPMMPPPGGPPVPPPHPPAPPPGAMPPPGGAGGPPPPMPRKSGGRTGGYMKLEAGAASGLGRLQKAKGKK